MDVPNTGEFVWHVEWDPPDAKYGFQGEFWLDLYVTTIAMWEPPKPQPLRYRHHEQRPELQPAAGQLLAGQLLPQTTSSPITAPFRVTSSTLAPTPTGDSERSTLSIGATFMCAAIAVPFAIA